MAQEHEDLLRGLVIRANTDGVLCPSDQCTVSSREAIIGGFVSGHTRKVGDMTIYCEMLTKKGMDLRQKYIDEGGDNV
jgi:hypothetical protein